MSEAELLALVQDYAELKGWYWSHEYDSRRKARRSHLTGIGAPDLLLVRERVVHAELKSARGKLSPTQAEWRRRLEACGAEYYVWRPDDWPAIQRVLA